jgi:D-amino peptidase
MEAVSQLRVPPEIFACRPEYWDTGRPRLEADVVAAVEGLIQGGASEVIVLDNHGSGDPVNISAGCLPDAARLETWNVFDLPEKGVDGMFQLGYHARGGSAGFVSHTYVPGLRLRVGDELISESHGRAWAARVPLTGIVGNDVHQRELGSLAGTPHLVVQRSVRTDLAEPVFGRDEGLDAIRSFAHAALREIADAPRPRIPANTLFAASMPNGAEQSEAMGAAGWRRTGDVDYAADLAEWAEARPLLAAAMDAAIAPLMPYLDGATSAAAAAALDPARVTTLSTIVERWCRIRHPDWYTAAGDELGLLTDTEPAPRR